MCDTEFRRGKPRPHGLRGIVEAAPDSAGEMLDNLQRLLEERNRAARAKERLERAMRDAHARWFEAVQRVEAQVEQAQDLLIRAA